MWGVLVWECFCFCVFLSVGFWEFLGLWGFWGGAATIEVEGYRVRELGVGVVVLGLGGGSGTRCFFLLGCKVQLYRKGYWVGLGALLLVEDRVGGRTLKAEPS